MVIHFGCVCLLIRFVIVGQCLLFISFKYFVQRFTALFTSFSISQNLLGKSTSIAATISLQIIIHLIVWCFDTNYSSDVGVKQFIVIYCARYTLSLTLRLTIAPMPIITHAIYPITTYSRWIVMHGVEDISNIKNIHTVTRSNAADRANNIPWPFSAEKEGVMITKKTKQISCGITR